MIAPGVLLLWTLLAASPSSPPPTPEDSPFAAALRAKAAREGATFFAARRGDLDGDGTPDDVVCADPPRDSAQILVRLSSGGLYRFAHQAWIECPEIETRGTQTLLSFSDWLGTGAGGSYRILFDDQGPLHAGLSFTSRYEDAEVDLLRQHRGEVDHSWMWDTSNDGGPACERDNCERRTESAVIVAGSRLPRDAAPTWVSYGRRQWTGPDDAGLEVRAMRRGSIITLVVELRDDLHVPARDGSPKGVLDADHLELWWSASGPSVPYQRVQLGIARGVDGVPVSVWFHAPPRKWDVPTVRWTAPERLEVDLPVAWFPWKGGTSDSRATNGLVPFTVVFSDSDGAGQETLISTSSWVPGHGFGSLVIAPEGRPLPVFGSLSWHDSWQQVDEAALLSAPLWKP